MWYQIIIVWYYKNYFYVTNIMFRNALIRPDFLASRNPICGITKSKIRVIYMYMNSLLFLSWDCKGKIIFLRHGEM